MSTEVSSETTIAFHPGYYVKQYLDSQQMTQKELADRLNTTEKNVSQLVNGKLKLNEDWYSRLAFAFGTSEALWRNLHQQYQMDLARVQREKELAKEEEILSKLDYSFWTNLGVVKKTRQKAEKVDELKRYLRISSLTVLANHDFLVQYRTAVKNVDEVNVINANAWVQTAMNIGDQQVVSPLNLAFLKEHLAEIRSLSLTEQDVFIPRLKEIFSKAGVAFVVVPHLKKSGISGAVKWLGKDQKEKALLAINDRKKSSDLFWFALFHEIRHVFQQKTSHIIISPDGNHGIASALKLGKLEQDADDFAANTLINPADYARFLEKGTFTTAAVSAFASEIGIQPGIVVGRLQRDGYLEFSQLNQLKQHYEILPPKTGLSSVGERI